MAGGLFMKARLPRVQARAEWPGDRVAGLAIGRWGKGRRGARPVGAKVLSFDRGLA